MKIYNLKILYENVAECVTNTMDGAEHVVDYMQGAYDDRPLQEAFYVLPLNARHQILGRYMMSLGLADSSLVHPREVFQPIILSGATAFIVCHNHPSGNPRPSKPDIAATRILQDAAKIMKIPMLDHIIIGSQSADPAGKGYYSFHEAGFIDIPPSIKRPVESCCP